MFLLRICAMALFLPLLVSGVTPTKAADANAPLSAAQEQAVRKLVRDTLLKDPAIIREAIEELQRREKVAAARSQEEALSSSRSDLENDPLSPVYGNVNGDVTVVEFFDYQCGYCKRSFPSLMKLVEDDGNIRLVLKELPILGPQSVYATRAALAAKKQGKYMEMHTALMKLRGKPSKSVIKNIAESLNIDVAKLTKDMDSDEITVIIGTNQRLAQLLGVRGTPAFVIGDVLVPGALSLEDLKSTVEQARSKARKEKG